MDNGPSSGTSCCKSLDGAMPGTFKPEDAGQIGLGSEGATLECKDSYLYALRRYGVNTLEVVLRRMKHTPKLPMAIVFSEATENVQYGYGIHWEPGAKRVLKSPQGTVLELLVSKSNLGWLKVKPITDISEVCALITADQANNMCMRLDCHQKMQAQLLAERHDALKLAIAQNCCCTVVFEFSYFLFYISSSSRYYKPLYYFIRLPASQPDTRFAY